MGNRSRIEPEARRHPGCLHRGVPSASRAGAWARSAASSCRSRIAATWVSRRSTKRPSGSSSSRGQTPGLAGIFSGFQINAPQVRANVDREKAKAQGVALNDLFETMQVYLGSLYVNDFNRFGRTYQVNAQAEMRFRLEPDDILRLKVRNAAGDMIPLGSFVSPRAERGAEPSDAVQRLSHRRDHGCAGARLFVGCRRKR